MNVWVNPNTGDRDAEFMQVYNLFGLEQDLTPYDPNNSGFHYGLYQTAQPSCSVWRNLLQQYQQYSGGPAEVIDDTGRIHRVMPQWYRQGGRYETLARNANPPYH